MYRSIAAAKNTFNSSSADSTQLCRSPCVASNLCECSPSAVRTRALKPSSWNWRITVSVFAGTRKRVSTSYNSSQLSVDRVVRFLQIVEAYMYRGIFLSRPSSRKRRTANNMPTIVRTDRKPHCCVPQGYSPSLAVVAQAERDDFSTTICLHEQQAKSRCSCCNRSDPPFSCEGP